MQEKNYNCTAEEQHNSLCIVFCDFIQNSRLYHYSDKKKLHEWKICIAENYLGVLYTVTCRSISDCSRKQFFQIVNLDGQFQKLMILAGLCEAGLNLNLSKGHSFTQTPSSQLGKKINETEVPAWLWKRLLYLSGLRRREGSLHTKH